MKTLIYLACFGLLIFSCKTEIKNPDANVIVEEGTNTNTTAKPLAPESGKTMQETLTPKINQAPGQQSDPLVGFWVGYFEKAEDSDDKTVYVDDFYMWNRENKINISIDEINGDSVTGHSVVAGNDRPFEGNLSREKDGSISFKVQEPGDDKYDGEFVFTIAKNKLEGTWTAYKNIDIKNRKYTLEKRSFSYNQEIMLEPQRDYINWDNSIRSEEKVDMGNNEFDEWVSTEFATATELIYSVNASNTELKKSQVENLKKGDLTIIRNTIYARHGYSFKNRPLRVFFDAQNWYIPVYADIKKDFTDLEKKNIKLLLQFEKNAAEYYDYFGR